MHIIIGCSNTAQEIDHWGTIFLILLNIEGLVKSILVQKLLH